MEKDIKQLIDEEAEKYIQGRYTNYIEQFNVLDKEELEQFSKEDYIAGFEDALSLFKWKNVKDELP